MTKNKKRILYALAAIIIFLIEVYIALYVHDNFVRPYLGDAIVVILVYCVVRIVIPEGCRLLPLYVFLFACFVEFTQYIHLVNLLGLQNNRLLCVIMGTSFAWEDIAAYAAGCILLGVYEYIKMKRI